MSSKSVTLADVAARVGVSARTVSRVVNNEGGCSPDTRDRIMAAIDELGYRPNLMARGLIRRRSDTIGLLTAEMLDPFFPEVAEGVQRAAARLGRSMFVAATHNDGEEQALALRSFQGHGVDGVIVFPAPDSASDLRAIARTGLPMVVVNDALLAPNISSVSAEIQTGAEMAVEHLAARGRTRIALLVDEAAHRRQDSRREAGYLAALDRLGIRSDPELIVPVANSLQGGSEGARHLLERGVDIDGIFAYNDIIAIGALRELSAAGVAVPEDVALVGFDDIAMCEATIPALTTIRIDRDLLGRTAVEALRDLTDGGTPASRVLPVELIVRAST